MTNKGLHTETDKFEKLMKKSLPGDFTPTNGNALFPGKIEDIGRQILKPS
jgi:hypothetical protein